MHLPACLYVLDTQTSVCDVSFFVQSYKASGTFTSSPCGCPRLTGLFIFPGPQSPRVQLIIETIDCEIANAVLQ